jgi:hypothetical protein
MEEPYEGENTNPEVIEDLYVLKTKIDTSDIAKLRRELQQVRYELAQAQSDVRRLRNSPEGSFSQVGNINITSQLKMELDRVNELKRQQAQIVNQINSGSIRDTSVFTQALGSLNNELENIGKNSQALDAAVTIMEGAMARMAAVSKKSQDYKQLQESFKSFGIEANITGSGGRLDLSKVSEEAERINNTPVTIKFNDQELNTTVGQLEFVEAILARIATQTKQNIVLTKVLGNQISSSIITPSAGSSRLSQHSYIPPAFFVERAQAVNRDNAGFTQPARAVMAAFHGTPLLSLESRQQIRAATSPTQARGTALEDVKEVLTQAGLVKQSPARNQFMTMGTSSFLDVSHIDKLSGVMDRVVTKIDSVILADIRYLGDRYGQRRQLTNRSQMGGIIDGILSDDTIANMEKAYHYQFAKQLALYNIDWKDTGGPQYYRRGTHSANISDKELAILDLVDQFPGSLKSSEITHALEMGHYQSLNSPVRDLQSKGLLRLAIVPPVPIPEAGIENQIHPAIMSLLATDPSLFLQFAMEASPIKFLDTSDRGRQVLEMMGTYNNPARVNTGMQLNAMVGNPEDTLVENYKSQMALPPANAWWLRGYNMLNYGDSASGSKLLYYLEQMLNNQEAYNPEFIKNILPFIPYTKDPKSDYISVNPEGWVGKDSQYQLYPTNAGQYLGARSDINWSLRTPYMFVDKIMEGIAHPNRDLFAKDMLGSEAYLKSVLNWASGPQGRGINPQLERYTITPEQATQYFKILFGSLKLDANLLKTSDKFETQYGRQYVPYNQYEKSIIIRAANEMLKRSLPISSGIDVGSLELLRSRSFMSKGEGAQVDKMLYVARQEELSQLIRAVPDLQRYFRAFEAYQKSVLTTYNANTSDLIGIFEEQADTLGTAKPVSPEMRRRIKNEQYAASSWKKYPEFWGVGYGQTYEDIYQGQNESFGMSPDLSISSAALSRINAQSEKAALRTKMPAPYINKFRKDTSRSPLKGFTGILPWNAVLEHYSQYGSQDLNEDGIREFERLMNNPAELMKEIMWDYTYVEGENTRNPQIKNVIMDTYGTVMRKHAMFGWISELKDPAAITALQQINDTYADKLTPGNIDIALGEYLGGADIQDEYDRFIINFTHNNWAKVMGDDKKGIKPTMGIFPLQLPLENIRDKIISNIERQASDAILDWTDKFGVETVNTRDITNVFKRRPDNTVSAFYEYIPEQVPVEDVIKRMVYDMQKGRMDPGLLEKYARAVASQKTRKDTGYSFKEGIESMWRNAGWDYEAMENLPQLVENQALFGFARTGTQGTFDFAGKQYQTGAGWDNQAIADSLGIDTSLIDDDMLHDMINTNMEFRGEVRSAAMNAMGVSSDKEWNQYIEYASHQVRQRLKRWQQISMSLQPGFDEFGENFTNTYTDDRVNFRTPYDFGDVQTEFGNIQDVSFLNWLKMEYFSRQPTKWPKDATTRGLENVQYDAMASSRDTQKRSWRKTDRERLQAWGVLQELPSVVSPVMSDEDVRQSYDGNFLAWYDNNNEYIYNKIYNRDYAGYNDRDILEMLGIKDLVELEFDNPKAIANNPEFISRYSAGIRKNFHPELVGTLMYRGLGKQRAADISPLGVGDIIPNVGTIQNWTHSTSLASSYAKNMGDINGVILQALIPPNTPFIMGIGREDKNYQFADDQDWKIAAIRRNVPVYSMLKDVFTVIPSEDTLDNYKKSPGYTMLRTYENIVNEIKQPYGPGAYYVDVDGTLLDESHDLLFKKMIGEKGFDEAVKWYDSTEVDNLRINEPLVKELMELRKKGAELHLWTNRGANQVEMTKRNLGPVWDLFSSHLFREGRKSKDVVPGEIWDNEERFLSQGTSGRLVDFEKMVGSSEVKQPFSAYTPDQDWFPMEADTSTIKYNRGFSMSESPASKMLGQMKDRFGISPMHQPNVVFTGSIPGDLAGSYILGKNKIEISKTAQDPASVMAHEYMHAVGNEKLVWKNNLQNMVDFYQGNNIPMFEHSKKVGEGLKNVKFDDIFKSSYLKGLKKSDPTAYARELERIAPFRKLFAGMSSDGVKNFFAMGEEIAIVMEKYHTDYEKHVFNLYGAAASYADKMKVAYVRNLVGINTAFPENISSLPAASPDTIRRFTKSDVKLGDVDISNMLGIGGQAMGNKFDPVTGLPADWFEGRPDMPWYEKVYNNAIWNRNAALNKQMKSLPDVSITEPGKLVTGRGTELPMTYQLSSDKVGGVEGIYAEYARFKKWLGEQGIDTSKLKYDVITQYGAEGSITHQGSLFGPLRIPDSVRKGRQMSDITKSIAENAGEGYRSFNEQAARYEDTMDKMPLWTERFGSLGKSIAGASWQFTTLQMAALGIFFSMMSIVSVMSQGIGLVIGGIGDLDAMMKAKAMAGMSGNFKDESGNVFTGAYIDEALGITDQTRIDAWKNLTDLSSTISTMLSGFGSKVLTDPKFLESANDFVGRLFNVVTNPDNLETVVNLSQTLFETIGNIVDKLPSLIKLFDMIASFHVPEGVPLIGGQSALSIYGQAALLSLIAMPIMAGATLLTKMSGWMLESVGLLGSIKQWNVGRQIEQFALKEGYSKEAAALFRATGGMPKVSPDDISFYKRVGVDLSKLPSTGLPEGYATAVTEAEKAARIAAGRQIAEEFAAQGIKANGQRIAAALEKAAVGIEAKSAGLMIFTAEDIMPKGWGAANRNAKLAKNEIPMELGMLNVPGTDMTYDIRTFGKEYLYGITHPSIASLAGGLPGPLSAIGKLYQFGASFLRSFDAANLTGKTAADTNAQYRWKVVNPLTGEEQPWTPGMEIPKDWQMQDGEMMPAVITQKWQEDSAKRRAEWAKSFLEGGFASTSPVDQPSWMPTPTEQANKLSNEPLNSRWQKENSTSFKQENYINVSMTDERLDSMDAKLNAVMRMLGA